MSEKIDCPECGAMLRAEELRDMDEPHCPECGAIFDPDDVNATVAVEITEPEPAAAPARAPRRTGRGRRKKGLVSSRGGSAVDRRLRKNDASDVGKGRIILFVLGGLSLLFAGLLALGVLGLSLAAAEARDDLEQFDQQAGTTPNEALRSMVDGTRSALEARAEEAETLVGLAFLALILAGVQALTFIGCGIWARKDPIRACQVGLGVYLAIMLLGFVIDPSSLISPFGWAIRLVIILGLVSAIAAGRRQQRRGPVRTKRRGRQASARSS